MALRRRRRRRAWMGGSCVTHDLALTGIPKQASFYSPRPRLSICSPNPNLNIELQDQDRDALVFIDWLIVCGWAVHSGSVGSQHGSSMYEVVTSVRSQDGASMYEGQLRSFDWPIDCECSLSTHRVVAILAALRCMRFRSSPLSES